MSYIKLERRNNQIYCQVNLEITNILPSSCFPLFFQILSINNREVESTHRMDPGTWRTYVKGQRDKNFRVITKDNIILRELTYDYQLEMRPLYLYEFWDYYTKINKNSIGVILGAGNGAWGEWVKGVLDNKINCFLIEGSIKLFNELKLFYENDKHLTLINELISVDGNDYDFYDHGGGWNSIDSEHIKKSKVKLDEFLVEKRKTKEINAFLKQIGYFNWIRFDLEGIDYELIMSLDLENYSNLNMIQYEHLDLENEKRQQIDDKFLSYGYRKLVYNIDTIFIK